ncbi:hypothetical protein Tco_0425783 [Tanacetum coccineum]
MTRLYKFGIKSSIPSIVYLAAGALVIDKEYLLSLFHAVKYSRSLLKKNSTGITSRPSLSCRGRGLLISTESRADNATYSPSAKTLQCQFLFLFEHPTYSAYHQITCIPPEVLCRINASTGMISTLDQCRCIDTRKSTSGGIQILGDKLVKLRCQRNKTATAMFSAEAKVENGIIELYFVRTEYKLADMFTKALPEDRFKYLVRSIGMRCLTSADLEVLTNETA